ncbi:MAG: hypothetical protein PVS2B1_17150 [Candidatus Dormibacteraceae bacterium]
MARRSQRPADRLSELEEKLNVEVRYLDLCLEIRRKTTGETLLRVGGRWDGLAETFDGEAKSCIIVYAKESQVQIVREFAAWLAAFIAREPRKRMMLTGGGRRGGKSFIMVALLVALAIAVPEALVWLVSPNLTKRDELERYIKEIVPPAWRTYRGAPEYRFTLPNLSTVQSITGDTAESLKRGEATAIGYNEPQTCSVDVATYGLPALIDEGGLAFFAGNPARTKKGMWFNNLRQAIVEGTIDTGSFFPVPVEDNDSIDQGARADFNEVMYLLDEEAAKRDAAGEWAPVGKFAYGSFEPKVNIGTTPQVGDVTAALLKQKGFRSFPYVGGADFQRDPWNAGVVLQAFGDVKRPIYYAVAEILKPGYEDDFLDEVYFDGRFQPENLTWVGDASGTWQDGAHSRGRVSFDVFKARRWTIQPPQVKKSDRGEHPRNPDVDDRLNLVNALLRLERLVIDKARCPRLAESLKACELGTDGKPRGRHAHITDALGYVLWWLEPRPAMPRRSGPEAFTVPLIRRSGDVI